MEQGLVENSHKETQKVYGMLVTYVMRCFPNEVEGLTYVVEFIIYNTPGAHGLTPRDLGRRWSAATPLERVLHPFQVPEFEPASDYVSRLFRTYRAVRNDVVAKLYASAEKRQELANRFRKPKTITPGEKVVLRDPRQRRAGGRSAYKQPLTDPCVVVAVKGNKLTVKRPDGTEVQDVHLEDVIVVPESVRDLESSELVFEEGDEELEFQREDIRRSSRANARRWWPSGTGRETRGRQ